jgi:hypothetical protein
MTSPWNTEISNAEQYKTFISILPTAYIHYEKSLVVLKHATAIQLHTWQQWVKNITKDSLTTDTLRSLQKLITHRLDTVRAIVELLFYELVIAVITRRLLQHVQDYGRVKYTYLPDLNRYKTLEYFSGFRSLDLSALQQLNELIKSIDVILENLQQTNQFVLYENIGEYASIEMTLKTFLGGRDVKHLIQSLSVKNGTFHLFKIGTMKRLQGDFLRMQIVLDQGLENIRQLESSQSHQHNLIDRVCWFDDHMERKQSILTNLKWIKELLE